MMIQFFFKLDFITFYILGSNFGTDYLIFFRLVSEDSVKKGPSSGVLSVDLDPIASKFTAARKFDNN